MCFNRDFKLALRRLGPQVRRDLLIASGLITEVFCHLNIRMADAVQNAFRCYRPAGVANGCVDLFGLNDASYDCLSSHQVSVLLPFCDSDSNMQLLVKKGVHVSIAKQIWKTVRSCDSMPVAGIINYVTLLLEG